jgi:hypothetical protein
MRNIVVIDPDDGIADLHCDLLRVEGEVVDLHLDVRSPDRASRDRTATSRIIALSASVLANVISVLSSAAAYR